ncbi:MAG: hypothetical protein NG740_01785 [Omnitrophica bacterium]|nr:hypothetical protein [Candidatus Omnitrophota bacterium]
MSIISQALEKAEKSTRVKGEARRFRPERTGAKKIKTQKRLPFLWRVAVIFFVFLIVAAAYTVNRSWMAGEVTTEMPVAREISEVRDIADALLAAETKESAKILPVAPKALSLDEVNGMVRLTGIMYTPQRPLAVVNDAVWSEGEHVGEFKILKIGENFLRVDRNGSEFVLRLKR